MSEWANLLRAIAALLWPIFAFVLLLVFKAEIREALNRLKRGKVFGQELEFEKKVRGHGQLRLKVTEAKEHEVRGSS